MTNAKLQIGWAQTSITPARPLLMEGQMYQRYSHYVHDPIMATALVLESGDTQAAFVALDMTEVPDHAFGLLRQRLERECPALVFNNISFNVTHSHNSSSFLDDFMRKDNVQVYPEEILPAIDMPEDLFTGAEAQAFFVNCIVQLLCNAWNAKAPGGISYAHDYAAVAFNRRPQFAVEGRNKSIMYGDCSSEDFVGFEAGSDTSVELLYTWNEQGSITGTVVNVPCPSQVYELHSFISADFWAPTRDAIREKLAANVYVLPLCGAAGDLAPVDLVRLSKTNRDALRIWNSQSREVFRDFDMTLECQTIADRLSEAVLRGYKTARNYIDYHPVMRHEVLTMRLPIRKVSEQEYEKALQKVETIKQRFSKNNPMTMEDLTKAFNPQGVVIRYRQQNISDEYEFKCHILRLGNIAIATNPFELFCEFAQRIKARAQAQQVFIVQLANGAGGYLPTREAIQGGSYSSKPASTRCGPEGGDALVEKTLEALAELWK